MQKEVQVEFGKMKRSCLGLLFLWSSLMVFANTDPCLLPNHTYNSIDGHVCHCCNPGFYKTDDCKQDGETAQCQTCGNNSYSATYNQALLCRPCVKEGLCLRQNVLVIKNCSKISNYVCQCRIGYHFEGRLGSNGDGDCIQHSPCGLGFELEAQGTETSDTKCRSCRDGTYSNSTSFESDACHNCTVCQPPEVVLQNCNAKRDTVCGREDDNMEGVFQRDDSGHTVLFVVIILVVVTVSVFILLAAIVIYCVRKDRLNSFQFLRKVRVFRHCFPDESGNDNEMSRIDRETGDVTDPLHQQSNDTYDGLKKDTSAGAPGCTTEPHNGATPVQYTENPPPVQYIENPPPVQYIENPPPGPSEVSSKVGGMTTNELEREWIMMSQWLSKQMPIEVWKAFIRCLFGTSNSKDNADNVIEEVIEDYQNKVREQIYQCLTQWRQKRSPKEWKIKYVVNALKENEQIKLAEDLKNKFQSLFQNSDL